MTCGTRDPSTPLIGLQGVDEGHREHDHQIQLCQRCLSERETRAWPLGSEDGQRLMDALSEHRLPAKGRYMYVKEGEEQIHLVRLRHDWFDRKAAIPA